MTVMQALADGGGMTGKGTSRGIVLHRRDATARSRNPARPWTKTCVTRM